MAIARIPNVRAYIPKSPIAKAKKDLSAKKPEEKVEATTQGKNLVLEILNGRAIASKSVSAKTNCDCEDPECYNDFGCGSDWYD